MHEKPQHEIIELLWLKLTEWIYAVNYRGWWENKQEIASKAAWLIWSTHGNLKDRFTENKSEQGFACAQQAYCCCYGNYSEQIVYMHDSFVRNVNLSTQYM